MSNRAPGDRQLSAHRRHSTRPARSRGWPAAHEESSAPWREPRPRCHRRGRCDRSRSTRGGGPSHRRSARPPRRPLQRLFALQQNRDRRAVPRPRPRPRGPRPRRSGGSARRHRTVPAGGPARRTVPIGSRPATSGRTCGDRRSRWARTSGRPSSQTVARPRYSAHRLRGSTGTPPPVAMIRWTSAAGSGGPRSAIAVRSRSLKYASPSCDGEHPRFEASASAAFRHIPGGLGRRGPRAGRSAPARAAAGRAGAPSTITILTTDMATRSGRRH